MKTTIINNVLHTAIGNYAYPHSPQIMSRIKRCAKRARLNWQTIAARTPEKANEFCLKVESACTDQT